MLSSLQVSVGYLAYGYVKVDVDVKVVHREKVVNYLHVAGAVSVGWSWRRTLQHTLVCRMGYTVSGLTNGVYAVYGKLCGVCRMG